MECSIRNVKSELASVLVGADCLMDQAVLSSIKADLAIVYADKSVEQSGVELLRFYLCVKDALCEAVVRGVPSSIVEQFEDILIVQPSADGCFISEPRPPYPIDSSAVAREHLSVAQVQSWVGGLEAEVGKSVGGERDALMRIFDTTQSRVLFEILKAVDGTTDLRSEV